MFFKAYFDDSRTKFFAFYILLLLKSFLYYLISFNILFYIDNYFFDISLIFI